MSARGCRQYLPQVAGQDPQDKCLSALAHATITWRKGVGSEENPVICGGSGMYARSYDCSRTTCTNFSILGLRLLSSCITCLSRYGEIARSPNGRSRESTKLCSCWFASNCTGNCPVSCLCQTWTQTRPTGPDRASGEAHTTPNREHTCRGRQPVRSAAKRQLPAWFHCFSQ